MYILYGLDRELIIYFMLTTTSIKDKREKLLGFIDQKAFDAILRLPPETYSGKDREAFETVRKRTLDDKRKFHAHRTPEEIKEKFLNDARADGFKKQSGHNLGISTTCLHCRK